MAIAEGVRKGEENTRIKFLNEQLFELVKLTPRNTRPFFQVVKN